LVPTPYWASPQDGESPRKIERHGEVAGRKPHNQRAAQPSLDVAARAKRGTGGGQGPAVVEVDRKRDVDLAHADRLLEERLTTI
jgi:hypothetical protein